MRLKHEIRKNHKGEVDEVVIEDDIEFFHLERMADDHIWMAITLKDDSRIVINLTSKGFSSSDKLGHSRIDIFAEKED